MGNHPFTKSNVFLAVSLALTSQLSLASEEVDATESQQGNENALEVITVSATKSATNLMKTPVAVSALNPEAMVRQNIKEVSDLSGMIPNLQLGLSTGDSGVQASIRGVTSTNFTEIGDPAVGIHIDGIYSPRPQGSLALMFDLEQVEVLRGAQGTLFGRNSTAGVINIIPAKPQLDDDFGWATVQLGNYNNKQLRSMYNFSVTDDFAVRAALMIDKRDGFINQQQDFTDRGVKLPDGWTGPDGKPDVDQRLNRKVDASDYYYNSDQWGIRLTGLWQVTPELEWVMGWEHYQNDGAGSVGLKDCEAAYGTRYACDSGKNQWDQTVLINTPGYMDMSIDTLRSILTYELNDNTTIEYRFAYANQQRIQHQDYDSGYHSLEEDVGVLYDWGYNGNKHVNDQAHYTFDSEYQSYVNELQIKQNFDSWRYVAGVFSLYEDNAIDFAVSIPVYDPVGFPGGAYYSQPKREIESTALFAQADFQVTDKLTATLGYRYSKDKRSDTGGRSAEFWWAPTPDLYNGLYTPPQDGGFGLAHNGTDLTFDMAPFAGIASYPWSTENSFEGSWSKSTWRAGLQYDLDDKQMVFASLATGYRPGGFGDNVDRCGGDVCWDGTTDQFTVNEYAPEETENFEIGYKGKLFDDSLNLSAVYFFTKYKNMHVTGTIPIGLKEEGCTWYQCRIVNGYGTENVGESDISGIELEADFIPWDNGRFTGFYAWLNSEIKSFPTFSDSRLCGHREEFGAPACAPTVLEDTENLEFNGRNIYDVTGNQLPYSPEHSFGINYSHYIEFDSGYQLVPWFGVRWQDRMYFSARNLDHKVVGDYQDSYVNVNASLKFSPMDEEWYIELYGTNLTDEVVKNWMGEEYGFQKNTYNPPRQYGIRFSMNF